LAKVREAVMGQHGNNFDDLVRLDAFLHTGDLEAVNALLLKYLPKKIAFSVPSTWIRSTLAAMDHNMNIDRQQARNKDGVGRWELRFSRSGKTATARPVRAPKDNL